jgi:ARG/rhodanese/phosphatase superfamily protein
MDARRRDVLTTLALALATCLPPGPARAQGPRILREPSPGDLDLAAGRPSPETAACLRSLRLGAVHARGPLTVVWLGGETPRIALDIATLEEARRAGSVTIAEHERATVPTLVVENRGATYVLVLAGEILLGGKQNRVMTEDVLLPPGSGPKDVAVYCVEQGRWSAPRAEFDARGSFAAPGLRSQVLARSTQTRVWSEVDRYSHLAAAPSPTRSYQHVLEQPEVKAHVDAVQSTPGLQAAGSALGAAAFVGPDLRGIDVFRTPGLFAREWPKLLAAYAVEAYGRPSAAEADERRVRGRVAEALQTAAKAAGSVRGSAGVGHLFEFRIADLRGAALVASGGVVHAALL